MTSYLRCSITASDDFLQVRIPWHPELTDAVRAQFKQIPGCAWNATAKAWEGPSEAVRFPLTALARAEVISPSVLGFFELERPVFEPVGQRPSERADARGRTPYEFQKEGPRFLWALSQERGAALLGDEMGLGKSIQAARAIEAELSNGGRALVVAPAVVVPNWENEFHLWTDLKTFRLGKKLGKRAGGGKLLDWSEGSVALVSFDTFRGLQTEASLARIITIDELHYVANPKAARSKALREYVVKVRKTYSNAVLYGLTGTPISSSPRDLWNPLDILFPKRFGTRFQYEGRYCEGQFVEIEGLEDRVWQADGKSNLEELGARLKHVMLRRTKSEVLELPERRRILFPVEMPEKALKNLRLALRSVALDPGEHVGRVLSNIEEYKLDAAVELTKELLASGKRPLLFTIRKESARDLSARLKCPYVTGDIPAQKRVELLAGTNETSKAPAVATIYSMTTGVNLTMFDAIIFVGLDWIPSTLLQAEARCHRIGSVNEVLYYYLVASHTADEIVRDRVLDRLDTFTTVVGGSEEAKLAAALNGNETEEEVLSSIVAAMAKMCGEA